MHELLNTGLYKCVRQYAMEIHMPGPLRNEKNMNRCRDIYEMLLTLEKSGGWQQYQTVDNIRAAKHFNPAITQMKIKENQFNRGSDIVLWENHFVNTAFEGNCHDYLQ